ncbi:MAG: hypothetical protein KAJ90_07480 [Desulfobacterales bacterium]|nr:hypothetical protein [Desulfobacterales bacterium]
MSATARRGRTIALRMHVYGEMIVLPQRMRVTAMYNVLIIDDEESIRASHRPFTPIIGISGTTWLLDGDEFDTVIAKPLR